MKLECVDREENAETTQSKTENDDGEQQSCFMEVESQLGLLAFTFALKLIHIVIQC